MPYPSPSSRIRRSKAVFFATGARYQFDIPCRYFAATAENRCSEDLAYSHALIRVPTIVQREFELAQRHGKPARIVIGAMSKKPL